MSFDRYSKFRKNGNIEIPFFVEIPKKKTDYYETYIRGISRLDSISYKYYGDCNYEWLILMANPELGTMEYLIPNNSELRIPYPLGETLEKYNNDVEQHRILYGE